jgi:hypothetical protein
MDDLHVELHHPEMWQNWVRALDRWRYAKRAVSALLGIGAILLVAEGLFRMVTHGRGDFLGVHSRADAENVVALAGAIAVGTWFGRRQSAVSQTQGYLDGFSDACQKHHLEGFRKGRRPERDSGE